MSKKVEVCSRQHDVEQGLMRYEMSHEELRAVSSGLYDSAAELNQYALADPIIAIELERLSGDRDTLSGINEQAATIEAYVQESENILSQMKEVVTQPCPGRAEACAAHCHKMNRLGNLAATAAELLPDVKE